MPILFCLHTHPYLTWTHEPKLCNYYFVALFLYGSLSAFTPLSLLQLLLPFFDLKPASMFTRSICVGSHLLSFFNYIFLSVLKSVPSGVNFCVHVSVYLRLSSLWFPSCIVSSYEFKIVMALLPSLIVYLSGFFFSSLSSIYSSILWV